MKRRRALSALSGWSTFAALTLAGGGLAERAVAAAVRGEPVSWPPLRLLDGSAWVAPPGHAVVVVFWSLSCPYCERHNAHLAKLHRAAAGQRLSVLSAVREPDASAVRRHMAQRGWDFPSTLAADALAAALGARRSVPFTVTIDRNGRLLELIPGEMFEADVMGFLKLAS